MQSNKEPTKAKTVAAHTGPQLGTVLDGRYELLEVIGLGGMCVVYRAFHAGMGRAVAVKFVDVLN